MSSNIFLLRQLGDITTILNVIGKSLENNDYYLSLFEVQTLLKSLDHLLQQNKYHFDISYDEVLNNISDRLTKLNASLSKITPDIYKKVGLEEKTLSANQIRCHHLITMIQNRPSKNRQPAEIKTEPTSGIQKEFEQTCLHYLHSLKTSRRTHHNHEPQLKLINLAIGVLSEIKKMTTTLEGKANFDQLNKMMTDTVMLATTPINLLREEKNFLAKYQYRAETYRNTQLQPIALAMITTIQELDKPQQKMGSKYSHFSGVTHTHKNILSTKVAPEAYLTMKLGK